MKEEICILWQEIYHKLKENNNEVQTLKSDISEARSRIAELEEWQLVANKNVATFGSHFASDCPTVYRNPTSVVLRCFSLEDDLSGLPLIGQIIQIIHRLFLKLGENI